MRFAPFQLPVIETLGANKVEDWEAYERAAREIIERFKHEFGFASVEGKQEIPGLDSGTSWEIDAKGICEDGTSYVLIECRRYGKKQNQEQLAALAFRIQDTGSSGGIIVSTLGLQAGADKIAKAGNIIDVRLHKDSTPETFMIEFLGRVVHGAVAHLKAGPATVTGVGEVRSRCKKCGEEFVKYGDAIFCKKCSA